MEETALENGFSRSGTIMPEADAVGHEATEFEGSSSPLWAPGARVTSGPEPGPWCGEIQRLVAGSELETLIILEAHNDPIAEHHTLGGRKVSALDPKLKGLPVLPFAVMAEMTAQAAALAVTPGLVLTGLTQVRTTNG